MNHEPLELVEERLTQTRKQEFVQEAQENLLNSSQFYCAARYILKGFKVLKLGFVGGKQHD